MATSSSLSFAPDAAADAIIARAAAAADAITATLSSSSAAALEEDPPPTGNDDDDDDDDVPGSSRKRRLRNEGDSNEGDSTTSSSGVVGVVEQRLETPMNQERRRSTHTGTSDATAAFADADADGAETRDGAETSAPTAGVGVRNDGDDEEAGGATTGTSPQQLLLQPGYWNDTFCDLISLDSPDRMKLTANELHCSLEIKRAIEHSPLVDNLSDYWYVQLGIIGQGDTGPMESAMARAIGMQIYRQRYGITDTLDQGKQSLQWIVDTMPELLLSMTYSEGDATWVFVGYLSQLNLLDTPDKVQKYFVASWYWHQAILSSDFHTIRKGPICAWECYGMGFCWGFRTIMMKIGIELAAFYPCNPKIKCYRTNSFANALVNMFKKVIAKNYRDKLEIGLGNNNTRDGTNGSRLDEIFLVPNARVASQAVLNTLISCLERRYQNETKFVLPQTTT